MLIHVIADFGSNDLAFAEVSQRISQLVPGATLHCTTVPPFATIAAGFCCAQLALNEGPQDMVVFMNVAPRRDDTAARTDNAGEGLVLVTLKNGRRVVAVNSGHSISFLAPHASSVRTLAVANEGSQFRSRDIYPAALARVLDGDESVLGEELSAGAIPAVPDNRIAYVDGFGNIKLSMEAEASLPEGDTVTVAIGGVTRTAWKKEAGFAVPQGELALSVGSSGWHGLRYRELFLRGGSAWELFGEPKPESGVTISEASEPA